MPHDPSYKPAVGDLVAYFKFGQRRRATVTKVTTHRVTLDDGQVFYAKKYGRPEYDPVTPAQLAFEVEHTAWLASKPVVKHVSAHYCSRAGISINAACTPKDVAAVITALTEIAAWAGREPKESR